MWRTERSGVPLGPRLAVQFELPEALRQRLSDLQDHAADLILAVQSSQLDPLYRKAICPAEWEADFAEARERLEEECEALERQNERRFRGLTDAMPLVVWAARPTGEIYYVNEGWLTYSGFELSESVTTMLCVFCARFAAV